MMMMITVKMIWAMTKEARQMNDDDNDERRLHLNDDVDDEGGMSVESGQLDPSAALKEFERVGEG